MRVRPLGILLAWAALTGTAHAAERPLTSQEKKAIGTRLARVINSRGAIAIEEGDTLFVVRRVTMPRGKVPGSENDYEGLAAGFRGPKGIEIDERIDQAKIRTIGDSVEIMFRYAITALPGTKGGGGVAFKLKLIARTGLGEAVVTVPVNHRITVRPARPTAGDLAADFWGFRVYRALASERIEALSQRGISGLSLRENAHLPQLVGVTPADYADALELDRWRRRAWIGYRHLVVASRGTDATLAAQAKKYLSLLEAPASKLEGLPNVAIIPGGEPIAGVATGGGASGLAGEEEAPSGSAVETLPPESGSGAAKPPPPPPPAQGKAGSGVETLAPLDTRPSDPRPLPEERQRQDEPSEPKTPVSAAASDPAAGVDREGPAGDQPLLRTTVIPSHWRFLLLDDVNIAHGGGVRFTWATVSARETAKTPAMFFGAQAGLTEDLGVELSVPTSYVSLNVERARPLFTVGNPLISAKFRFHLPEVVGDRPIVTLRARWAVPIAPLHSVPPTDLGAEDFTFAAHFADTSAFLLEKHGIGAGLGTSWRFGMVHVGLQGYLDYFTAVEGSIQDERFFTLSYGGGVGIHPFGDIAGAYLEARGATLLIGPRRSELFTYFGFRGRFFDLLEPAVWISLPVGSVGDVGSLQFGAEIRVAYDVDSVIVHGAGRRSDQFELD